MADIDFNKLITDMLGAAKNVLTDYWEETSPYAKNEFKAFANNVALIAALKLEGKINEEQARLYMELQKSSMRTVLLTIKGLGILAVEAAINAALDIARGVVNTALGWTIL